MLFGLGHKEIIAHPILLDCTITSDGRSARELVHDLAKKHIEVSEWAEILLYSKRFRPTKGVTYQLIGFRGGEFFEKDRDTRKVMQAAAHYHYPIPSLEVAPLLCEKGEGGKFEFGSSIAVCHKPLRGRGGYPNILVLHRDESEGRGVLDAWLAFPHTRWPEEFLFVVGATIVPPAQP